MSGDFKGRENIHGISGNSGGSASYNNGIGAGFSKKDPNRQKGVFDRDKDTNITNPLYLKEKENGRGVLSLNPYGYKAESKKAGGNGTAGERSPYGDYSQKSSSFGYPKSFGVNRYFDILDKGTGKRTHKIESAKNEDRAYRYGVYGGNGFRVTPYTKREERAEDFQKPERSNSKRFYDLLYKKNFNKYNYIGPPDFEDVKKYPNLNNNQLINIKNDEEKFKNADMSLPKYNNYMERKDYLDKKNKIYSNNQVNRQLKLYGADKLNFNNVYALIKNPGFEYMSISDLNNMSILDRQRVYCIFRNEGLKERNNYISNLKKVNKKDREKQEYINYLNSSHFDPIEEFADLGRKNEISNKLKNVKKAMELMLGDYSVSDKSFVNLTADYFKENGTEEQKEAMDAGKTEINIGYGLLSGYLNTLLSLTLNTLDSYGGVYNSSAEYDSNTETLKDIKEKAKRESLAGLTADIVAGGVGLDTDAIKEIDFLSKEIGVPIVEWILSGIMKNNIYRKDE